MKFNLFRTKEVMVSNVTNRTYSKPLLHSEYKEDAGQALKDFATKGTLYHWAQASRYPELKGYSQYQHLTDHPEEVYKILSQYYGDK